MRNEFTLKQATIGSALTAATVIAMPPLTTKAAKSEAAKVSLALLKSKDNLDADGKS
jgi:hypothetical protein